jgi:hypothetical protein
MVSVSNKSEEWIKTSPQIFWGEIAPYDHVVQIYENDAVFLDLLSGFVSEGIKAGDSVIVIGSGSHIKELEAKLDSIGYNISHLVSKNQYFPLDAEKTLAKFMINDWPDEKLFNKVVSDVIVKAKGRGRKVRAFGEMVAILWAKGQVGATVRLEHLWNKFCENEAFCLFCAYPQSGFVQDASESVTHICSAHSKMIGGFAKSKTELFYKEIN